MSNPCEMMVQRVVVLCPGRYPSLCRYALTGRSTPQVVVFCSLYLLYALLEQLFDFLGKRYYRLIIRFCVYVLLEL